MVAAEELAGQIGQTTEACEALGVARSTLYRRRQVTPEPKRRPRPHRALDETEREEVLGALHCERFVDKAPAQVWATLLDEGTYLCSIRTMYRILEEHGEVRSAGTNGAIRTTRSRSCWPKRFFRKLGPQRAAELEAVSMDMWEPYITVVGKKAPQARVIFDRFHIVKHLNEAVDKTRRELSARAQRDCPAQPQEHQVSPSQGQTQPQRERQTGAPRAGAS